MILFIGRITNDCFLITTIDHIDFFRIGTDGTTHNVHRSKSTTDTNDCFTGQIYEVLLKHLLLLHGFRCFYIELLIKVYPVKKINGTPVTLDLFTLIFTTNFFRDTCSGCYHDSIILFLELTHIIRCNFTVCDKVHTHIFYTFDIFFVLIPRHTVFRYTNSHLTTKHRKFFIDIYIDSFCGSIVCCCQTCRTCTDNGNLLTNRRFFLHRMEKIKSVIGFPISAKTFERHNRDRLIKVRSSTCIFTWVWTDTTTNMCKRHRLTCRFQRIIETQVSYTFNICWNINMARTSICTRCCDLRNIADTLFIMF